MRFNTLTREKIDKVPKTTGVYALKTKREILYIGKASDLRDRVKSHLQKSTYRDNLFIDQVSHIGYIETESDIDALLLESKLIKKQQPKYNVMWRDDKKYFYIAIDGKGCVVAGDKFPRVYITHQPSTSHKSYKSRNSHKSSTAPKTVKASTAEYIGPFVDGKAVKRALRLLRRAFPYYTAKKTCLYPLLLVPH